MASRFCLTRESRGSSVESHSDMPTLQHGASATKTHACDALARTTRESAARSTNGFSPGRGADAALSRTGRKWTVEARLETRRSAADCRLSIVVPGVEA